MICQQTKARLGELLDGELAAERRVGIERHLRECPDCRAAYNSLRELADALGRSGREWPATGGQPAPQTRAVTPPVEEIWSAIERRLDDEPAAPCTERNRQPAPIRFPHWRALASAAALALAIGLGWVLLSNPATSVAYAGQIDFRPLLERANGDIKAGIDALLAAHGGRPVTRSEAAAQMRIRIHAAERLPHGLVLQAMYMLSLGRDHTSLALHYQGPAGQLLLLQCPPGVRRNYGGPECLPCRIGSTDGHITRMGPLRLVHFESENVCVCVVSTLDENSELPAVLDAVRIEF
jgi:anti-sigma factor RsiW